MAPASTRPRPRFSAELLCTLAIGAAYLVWVLSLPVFPTQDGPMHLYYAHVLSALLFHHDSVYQPFFYIKHILPPYSLYYYCLIALMHVVPELLADKLVICLYFVLFLTGFRFLARQIGTNADQMTLLVTTLLLNWPLVMGFVNFSISLSLGFWALGLWFQLRGRRWCRKRFAFLLLTLVMMLTHPVPFLFLLLFLGGDLLVRAWRSRVGFRDHFRETLLPDTATFLCSVILVGYIKLFTARAVFEQTVTTRSSLGRYVHHLQALGPFAGADLQTNLYRLALACVLLFPILIALSDLSHARSANARLREPSYSRPWLIGTLVLLLLLPLVPHDLNSSHFFADRLVIFLWLSALLSGAAARNVPRAFRTPAIVVALLANGFILFLANARIRPVANSVASLVALPAMDHGQVGLLLQATDRGDSLARGLSFDPFLWAAVHYVRGNDAILYNPPWLHLQVIPLGAKGSLGPVVFSPVLMDTPGAFSAYLRRMPSTEQAVFAVTAFALVNQGIQSSATKQPEPWLSTNTGPAWNCPSPTVPWVTLCRRNPAPKP